MDKTSLKDQKAALREQAYARRRAFAQTEGVGAGLDIRDHFIEAGLTPAPGTVVSGYWPMADEADVRPLMEHLHGAGMQLSLPVQDGKDKPLLFRAWKPGDPLMKRNFGVMEPRGAQSKCRPEVLLVPLVAFDTAGTRLGYGGGYYDRTLADLRGSAKATKPLAVGVAFTCQQVDTLPKGEFDQPLDWIVTEAGASKFPPA